MDRFRLFRLLTVGVLALLAWGSAERAGAAAPFFLSVEIDRAKVLSASAHSCEFPIVVHEQGTWELSFHAGPDGTFREIRHAQLTVTYTNQLTGASVSGQQTRGLNIQYDAEPPVVHADGSVTVTDEFVGAFQNVVVPGIGSIAHNAGRLLTTHTFGPAPSYSLLGASATLLAGTSGPLSPRLCQALS